MATWDGEALTTFPASMGSPGRGFTDKAAEQRVIAADRVTRDGGFDGTPRVGDMGSAGLIRPGA